MSDGFTIKEYISRMDRQLNEKLDTIHEQVKKTNGRVSELEKWRAYLTGAVALALAFGLPNLISVVNAL
jgi:hypothetical protein